MAEFIAGFCCLGALLIASAVVILALGFMGKGPLGGLWNMLG